MARPKVTKRTGTSMWLHAVQAAQRSTRRHPGKVSPTRPNPGSAGVAAGALSVQQTRPGADPWWVRLLLSD
jgi:hypothetical protein